MLTVVAALVIAQALLVLSLRWVDPPTTAFMAANPEGSIQESVPVEHVSRTFLAAVIAHEDAALPYRAGAFEWSALWSRAYAHISGEEDPSGSTIPQQVAKNMFLNQELSAWRKGLEAGLSMEMAWLIDDRRMLELYVNYAQFGPTIYGVCSASWYYFDSPPGELSQAQAVQLVGLLPSPDTCSAHPAAAWTSRWTTAWAGCRARTWSTPRTGCRSTSTGSASSPSRTPVSRARLRAATLGRRLHVRARGDHRADRGGGHRLSHRHRRCATAAPAADSARMRAISDQGSSGSASRRSRGSALTASPISIRRTRTASNTRPSETFPRPTWASIASRGA
ncbi:transglycosylase domain-containing protein [Blastococcus brunescens]|uniref:Transglycosylase domain-containing protein n=1 Tax=Blastococcus brunescens TaxID=1564165 RepID=A0ABZ1AVK9_9ACTN|nr:transglycosylase domain-containing protein [Blastococcus sp. BMG 8361]WRL62177.1 transglycosylase domain-containing protein [Blastococcus sp. BMG 8361]